MKRTDEREIMFARMRFERESEAFKTYYKDHPDHLEIDENLRQMPEPYGPGTATYHPHIAPFADAGFTLLSQLKDMDDRPVNPVKTQVDAGDMTKQIKALLTYMGVSDVGVCKVDLYDMYSHRGRMGLIGQPVTETLPHAIVLVYEMDKTCINRAPQLEEGLEVVKAYTQLATVSLWLSHYLKHLGYGAKAHLDGNYAAFLPPIAEKAGLGQVGRMTTLVHPEFGPRVRLGMVTTDMPLVFDQPRPFGLHDFCQVCNRCSMTCPGKAISKEDQQVIEGKNIEGWSLKQEDCYAVWRRVGTDCGVCLSVCPFSQGFTQEEWADIKTDTEGMARAMMSYTKRIPIRVYHPKPLDHISYPKPPLE